MVSCKVDDYGGSIDSGAASKFGSTLCEFDMSKGWIESCKFSPSGMRFAFTGHDSTVHFGSFADGKTPVQTVQRSKLPLRCIAFLTDTIAVGAGYDCVPVLYEFDGKEWVEKGDLDTGAKSKAAPKKKESAFGGAFAKFQNASKYGAKGADDAALPFRHQNMINDIDVYGDDKFTTPSVDGPRSYVVQKHLTSDLLLVFSMKSANPAVSPPNPASHDGSSRTKFLPKHIVYRILKT